MKRKGLIPDFKHGFKRLLYLTLSISLVVTSLAGCSSKKEKAKSGSNATSFTSTRKAGDSFHLDTPLTITSLFNDNAGYPMNDDWLLWKAITDKTNVTLDIQSVPGSDYSAKLGVLIGSGEIPYIIPKIYGGGTQYVSSGMILPISDYIDLLPNFKEKVEKWGMEKELKTITQADGKYYVLPGMHEKPYIQYSYAVRSDELKKLGIAEPTNYEEFYTMLKKLKEAHPDTYPFSDRFLANSTMSGIAADFYVGSGWGKGSYYGYVEADDKFEFLPLTDNFKKYLNYMHKLVAEGLMDPESFTQTDDQAVAKFVSGKSYVIGANTQSVQTYKETLDEKFGAGNTEVTQIVPPSTDGTITGSRLENGIMLSAKVKDDPRFEEIMGFVDWLWYSDEGQMLTKWGVEGTTYTKDADGNPQLKPDITFNGNNPAGKIDLRKEYGFSCGNFSYGGSWDLMQSLRTPQEKAFVQACNDRLKLRDPAPALPMDEDQLEEVNSYTSQITDYVDAMTLKFILGTADINSDWDNFAKECQAKGSDKLIELINQIYENTSKEK